MKETKETIIAVSLDLFSQKGYSAVSIRDICREVGIKESSVYYHFKNKQAIFDEILSGFQQKAAQMMDCFTSAMTGNWQPSGENFYMEVCRRFFEDYLMEDFCNKVMRLMLIEQHHNEHVKKIYDHWMFTEPLAFQSSIFRMLMDQGMLPEGNSEYIAVRYYAPVFFFAQKWLLSGPLTDENKNAFRKDAYQHIQYFFSDLGGAK